MFAYANSALYTRICDERLIYLVMAARSKLANGEGQRSSKPSTQKQEVPVQNGDWALHEAEGIQRKKAGRPHAARQPSLGLLLTYWLL